MRYTRGSVSSIRPLIWNAFRSTLYKIGIIGDETNDKWKRQNADQMTSIILETRGIFPKLAQRLERINGLLPNELSISIKNNAFDNNKKSITIIK